jgi:hypothetical protein
MDETGAQSLTRLAHAGPSVRETSPRRLTLFSQGLISLIVPTRGRPAQLAALLRCLAATVSDHSNVEVILVTDADDPASRKVPSTALHIHHVVVPPGQTMGTLNMAGYEVSRGRYLMLLNDDVVPRTPGWDDMVRRVFGSYPDDIALVHVNDLVMQRHLCTFPIVSRAYCDIAGGICPRVYRRYRIDDHIEDHFNLLGVLGQRRIVFTPEVIFEHHNYTVNSDGLRQYFSDPAILARDAPVFEELLESRKQTALKFMAHITGRREVPARWRRKLNAVTDSFALRTPDRQRIFTGDKIVDPWVLEPRPRLWSRAVRCLRERGMKGIWRALKRRLSLSAESEAP